MTSYSGISVIVPVFNREMTLERCLDSIVSQDYTNLEIICVDDGSTDMSVEILDRYAVADKRIKVIHKENSGVSSARNCGIKLATMPLITFVDSDDCIEPQMYSKMIDIISANRLDCVCCNYRHVLPNGSKQVAPFDLNNRILNKSEIEEEVIKSAIGFSSTQHSCLSSVWNKIFITEIIRNNNLQFDESRSHGEDWLFCIQYYAVIESMGFLSDVLYNYISTEVSLVSKPRRNAFKTSVETIELFKKIFPKFEWESGPKYEEIKNRPFISSLYYYKVFKGKEREELLSEIYRVCKEKNYYSDLKKLNNKQQQLKEALEKNDESAFVKCLKQKVQREYMVYRFKVAIKEFVRGVLKLVKRKEV